MELIGNEVWSDEVRRGQVYQATHDGEGNRLPFMNRSFMSFSYGGKYIEDFNLIATLGDRLSKNVYAEFEDSTSDYDTMDGQYYWGTHMNTNTLEFTLSTDYITQVDLDNFKRWFRPGVERELILAEHPNRAIMARVSAPPAISMIPYGEAANIIIEETNYETMTTIYRGDITLSFVMDEPFWYGKLNYMPASINEKMEIVDANSEGAINTKDNKDCLKIILEDGIPYQTSVNTKTFLGGEFRVVDVPVVGPPDEIAAKVNFAILGGRSITSGIDIFSSGTDDSYLFYSGTAKSYPTISFDIEPISSSYYIISPLNKLSSDNEYSNITLTYPNDEFSIFSFTTPSIWTAYNYVIKLIKEFEGQDVLKFKELIRDNVKEQNVRAYTIKQLSTVTNNNGAFNEGWKDSLLNLMNEFLCNNTPAHFIINSKTGEAKGTFHILNSNGEEITIEENIGDMIRSDYLIIDYRNNLDVDGMISSENCTLITSTDNLKDFKIKYQNMYL